VIASKEMNAVGIVDLKKKICQYHFNRERPSIDEVSVKKIWVGRTRVPICFKNIDDIIELSVGISTHSYPRRSGWIMLWRFRGDRNFQQGRELLEIFGTGYQKTSHVSFMDELLVFEALDRFLRKRSEVDNERHAPEPIRTTSKRVVSDQIVFFSPYHTKFSRQLRRFKE
jgi:hypothetical protein